MPLRMQLHLETKLQRSAKQTTSYEVTELLVSNQSVNGAKSLAVARGVCNAIMIPYNYWEARAHA